jgi:hypothetical protein
MKDQFCSMLSAQAGEAIIGTAGRAEVFFLLEYRGAWEDKAFEKSAIPDAVKQRLSEVAKSLPAAKVLLIKQDDRSSRLIRFFVAIASDTQARLVRFELGAYEDLLAIDLPAVMEGYPLEQGQLLDEPLYLVCTNGRRDACCARSGFPVYQALSKLAGLTAWECSHIGGHRFAANVYELPSGILYGRVSEADVPALLAAGQAGQLRLENLRGRTVYPPAAQAAEFALRQQTGESSRDAYRLEQAVEEAPGQWRVEFLSNRDGKQHVLQVRVEKSTQQVFESCSLDKLTSPLRFTF